MNELVVVSGKGGTGKTSLVAAFASLARDPVVADCDVGASDLHLVLAPAIERREPFVGGVKARIEPARCAACGGCAEHCRFGAVLFDGPGREGVPRTYRIDRRACEGCGVCARFCPGDAVRLEPSLSGECLVSRTRFGPMVHSTLAAGEENSGKLVSRVRVRAREVAERTGRGTIIADGAPGIACPVIASVTGADLVLVVTEPTVAGLHDMERVVRLVEHFRIPVTVVVNKHDINPEWTERIEARSRNRGIPVSGRIRYSREVTRAMIAGKTIVEHGNGPIAADVRALWSELERLLREARARREGVFPGGRPRDENPEGGERRDRRCASPYPWPEEDSRSTSGTASGSP